MLEILTTVMLSIMAIASPTLPYDYHSYTAKASSLNDAVLAVSAIPYPPEKSLVGEEMDENTSNHDFDTSEGLNRNLVRENGLDEVRQDPPKQEIVKMIKKHFWDEPLMVKVAECESIGLRHYVKGEVLRGEQVKEDRGLFQINETYWLEKSIKLGIDIYDLEGNIKMARHIYDTQGLSAWSASFKNCWKNM